MSYKPIAEPTRGNCFKPAPVLRPFFARPFNLGFLSKSTKVCDPVLELNSILPVYPNLFPLKRMVFII